MFAKLFNVSDYVLVEHVTDQQRNGALVHWKSDNGNVARVLAAGPSSIHTGSHGDNRRGLESGTHSNLAC
jgi:hypothetical protein